MKLLKKWLGIQDLENKINFLKEENKKLKVGFSLTTSEVNYFSSLAKDIQAEFKRHTSIDLDVNRGGERRNKIVLTGSFKGKDYCNIIEVNQDEFRHLVNMYSDRSRLYSTGRIDVPFNFDKEIFKHEAKKHGY